MNHRPFSKKQLAGQKMLGEILREERESTGWSIEEAAKRCRLDKKYIVFLENGAYDRLPGGVYTKNFMKRYGQVLGFETGSIVKRFEEESQRFKTHVRADTLPKAIDRDLRLKRLLITPVLFRNIILAVLILAGLFYLSWELYDTVTPPELSVESPPDQTVLQEPQVEVVGRTEQESAVFINNQEILVDISGFFRETVSLQDGVNVIEIRAVKKHSRPRIIRREVLVEEKAIPIQ